MCFSRVQICLCVSNDAMSSGQASLEWKERAWERRRRREWPLATPRGAEKKAVHCSPSPRFLSPFPTDDCVGGGGGGGGGEAGGGVSRGRTSRKDSFVAYGEPIERDIEGQTRRSFLFSRARPRRYRVVHPSSAAAATSFVIVSFFACARRGRDSGERPDVSGDVLRGGGERRLRGQAARRVRPLRGHVRTDERTFVADTEVIFESGPVADFSEMAAVAVVVAGGVLGAGYGRGYGRRRRRRRCSVGPHFDVRRREPGRCLWPGARRHVQAERVARGEKEKERPSYTLGNARDIHSLPLFRSRRYWPCKSWA